HAHCCYRQLGGRALDRTEASDDASDELCLSRMLITFTKISDEKHAVKITRSDGSTESAELESRSYLRHDLAHFAIELELPIRKGYWGCVAYGAAADMNRRLKSR